MSSGAAWIVRDMLETALLPDGLSIRGGTRPRLAWKTGTSFGYRDAWAIGVTPTYTLAVWIGRPDGTPLPGQYGAATALPVLVALIDGLPRQLADGVRSVPPSGVHKALICWLTGVVEPEARADLCHQQHEAWLLDANQPPTLPSTSIQDVPRVENHVIDAASGLRVTPACARGETSIVSIARWPLLAEPWLSPSDRKRSTPPRLKSGCKADVTPRETLHIDGVVPAAVFRAMPGAERPPAVTLRVRGMNEPVDWLVNDVRVTRTNPG